MDINDLSKFAVVDGKILKTEEVSTEELIQFKNALEEIIVRCQDELQASIGRYTVQLDELNSALDKINILLGM